MARLVRPPHDEAMTASTQTPRQTPPLRRPFEDRAFAGVAGGLAQRFNVSAAWFRVGFVLLALFGGIGFFLYALGWILIPDEGSDQSLAQEWIDGFDASNTAMVVGVVLIGIAVLTIVTSFNLMSGKFIVAGILLVIGVMLYRGDLGGTKPSPDADDPPDEAKARSEDGGESLAVGAVDASGDEEDTLRDADAVTTAPATAVVATRAAPVGPPPAPVPVRPPKPRSILGRVTVAATLIAVGGLALLDVAGILYPDPVHYLAVAVGVIGGGLLIGTIFGHARWLIFVGLILIPFLVVASVVSDWSFSGEAGERYVRVETISDLEVENYDYVHTAGVLEIDLRWFDVPTGASDDFGPIVIDARITAGEVRILLPEHATAHVEGSAGMGSVELFGSQSAGIGVSRTSIVEGSTLPGEADVSFIITTRADFGSVVVDVVSQDASEFRWEG